MTIEELNKILSHGEDTRTEFKQANTKVPANLYETVCSFLNREGGTIVLGVNDEGNVTGISSEAVEQLKKDIITAINNKDVIDPPVNFPLYEMEINSKKVLCIKIPVSSQVHTCFGIIFDRENDSDIRILDEVRKSDIYFRKRQDFTENIIYPALTLDDLDPKLFEKARSLLRAVNPDHPWLEEDNLTLLRRSLLYRKDFKTHDEGFTLAAALVFGKDETIQSILPAYKVEAMVRRENVDRWDDRLTLRTNLIDTYQQLMAFVRKHLDNKFYLEGDVRKDLRDMIFREVVANIIVHREYTNGFSTDFIIYKDRVEVTNPNKILFRGPLSLETFSPYAKNPNIRKLFNEFRWTDEIGSGVRNVYKYLKAYANGARPLFLEDDLFKTIIPLKQENWGNRTKTIVEFFGLQTSELGEGRLTELAGIILDTNLAKIEDDEEFLFRLGGSLTEKGGKLKNSRIQIINKISLEDFKLGGSLIEKGGKLFSNRTFFLLKVLISCITPASNDELLEIVGFSSREKLRENYLMPLRKDELITYNIKDKPNSPNQKYIITEKGRMLLGGFDV
jgi:ATP-dependent DNA helicase RecG